MAGDGERGQGGDVLGPGQGLAGPAHPVDQAEAEGIGAGHDVGGQQDGPGPRWPASAATRWTVQWLTISPSLAAGMPKLAVAVATRRSHATASWVPAPRAAPSTAAMVGKGVSQAVEHPLEQRGERGSSTPVRSAPAQKWPPAPVSTSTRVGQERREGVGELLHVSGSTALRRSGRSRVTTRTSSVRRSMWMAMAGEPTVTRMSRERVRELLQQGRQHEGVVGLQRDHQWLGLGGHDHVGAAQHGSPRLLHVAIGLRFQATPMAVMRRWPMRDLGAAGGSPTPRRSRMAGMVPSTDHR